VKLPTQPAQYDRYIEQQRSGLIEREFDRLANAPSPRIIGGTGSPEAVVSAPVGTLYVRADGAPGATLYVKEAGSGNTGWSAK
jgi:hypothetical protein